MISTIVIDDHIFAAVDDDAEVKLTVAKLRSGLRRLYDVVLDPDDDMPPAMFNELSSAITYAERRIREKVGKTPMTRSLSYEVKASPGKLDAVSTCANCAVRATVNLLSTGGKHNPEDVAKKFRRIGWDFDRYVSRRCLCPHCKQRTPEMARTTTPIKPKPKLKLPAPKLNAPQPALVDTAAIDAVFNEIFEQAATRHIVDPPEEKEKTLATAVLDAKLKEVAQEEPVVPAIPTPTRLAISSAERAKIRSLLDAHFDDSLGAYLDAYSDQRIAREVGVASSVVAEMREAAYGEILIDPVATALQEELRKTHEDLGNLTEDVKAGLAHIDRLREHVDALAQKVEEYAQVRKP